MSRNNRKKRKIFLLFIVILITSVVLAVETYTWFVGLSTVNISSFTISISSGSGLEISMDGPNWQSACTDYSSEFECSVDNFFFYANAHGYVYAGGSGWHCIVNGTGGGNAYCYA